MSTYAIDKHGQKVNAADALGMDTKWTCDGCGEAVTYVRGHKARRLVEFYDVAPHFRHTEGSTCPLAATESAEHMAMKQVFEGLFGVVAREQIVTNSEGTRRADLVCDMPDGITRVVELQRSPIAVSDVAGRNATHAAAGMPVLWAWSPARIVNGGTSILEGVSEQFDAVAPVYDSAERAGLWRGIQLLPSGQAVLSHVFYDMRWIDTPKVIREPIDLGKAVFGDIKSTKGIVTTVGSDQDRVLWEISRNNQKAKDAYQALLGQFQQFLDRRMQAQANAEANGDPSSWRAVMLEMAKEDAGKFNIKVPVELAPSKRRLWCDRMDRRLEEIERGRRAYEAHVRTEQEAARRQAQVMAEQAAQRQRREADERRRMAEYEQSVKRLRAEQARQDAERQHQESTAPSPRVAIAQPGLPRRRAQCVLVKQINRFIDPHDPFGANDKDTAT